jgi:hypothetical protein
MHTIPYRLAFKALSLYLSTYWNHSKLKGQSFSFPDSKLAKDTPKGENNMAFARACETPSVPKLHVRHLFGLVRPWTGRFEGLLDWTIIIF